jgi:hypothetical protein
MKIRRREFTGWAAGALLSPAIAHGQVAPAPRTSVWRGRVICLTEEMERRYGVTPDCEHRGHLYALRDAKGDFHPFLPTDTAAAIYLDDRFRTRELQVTARAFPELSLIEVIKLQSWRDGRLYDLDYYCEVCNISTHKPGPCDCCQDPVQFRETPAGSDESGR